MIVEFVTCQEIRHDRSHGVHQHVAQFLKPMKISSHSNMGFHMVQMHDWHWIWNNDGWPSTRTFNETPTTNWGQLVNIVFHFHKQRHASNDTTMIFMRRCFLGIRARRPWRNQRPTIYPPTPGFTRVTIKSYIRIYKSISQCKLTCLFNVIERVSCYAIDSLS